MSAKLAHPVERYYEPPRALDPCCGSKMMWFDRTNPDVVFGESSQMSKQDDKEWREGVLMAVSILVAAHDQPTMGGDVLHELGLSDADCSNLDDFDKHNLKKVRDSQRSLKKLRGLKLTTPDNLASKS